MLYDPNWKPADIKVEPWQQVLLDAAAIIEKYGWVQGCLGSPKVGYCALGAIGVTAPPSGRKPMLAAAMKIELHLHGDSIVHWNDSDGQTKEHVVATMRLVAQG